MTSLPAATVAAIYRDACRFDVLASKPGNVSIAAPGHGMVAKDFLRSAAVTSSLIANASLGVGAAVHQAVAATRRAVGCNTNLGILLLAAPLAQAALRSHAARDLRTRLSEVLAGLSQDDAREAFRGIVLAQPAGLGEAAVADVAAEPGISLFAAMQLAAPRDRIAWNFVHTYEDLFDLAIPTMRAVLQTGERLTDAMVAAYLRLLASTPDTHIARKHGSALAEQVRRRAAEVETRYKACEDPAAREALVFTFDRELKHAEVNPGTSADLTMASLMAMSLAAALQNAR